LYRTTKYLPVGDSALLVEFGSEIHPSINQKVHALDCTISNAHIRGIVESVPTYRSLLIYFNPQKTSYEQLVYKIRDIESSLHELDVSILGRAISIPAVYGGEYGPDLKYVAECHGISEDEVIKIHSKATYLVYMIGFLAGFPYLGVVDDKIATPRLETPRLHVPAGSIGIAEKQTGIYPCEAPGGWQIIARTPLKLFSPKKDPPTLIKAGDTVRFNPIDEGDFESYIGERK
jgi:inhibitor of KinA